MDDIFQVYISFVYELDIVGCDGVILLLERASHIGETNHMHIVIVAYLRSETLEYHLYSIIDSYQLYLKVEWTDEGDVWVILRYHFALKSKLSGVSRVA